MNKIIIDGYNFIHAIPELAAHLQESLERAREALLSLLKTYCYRREVKVVVVFDGTFPPFGVDPPHPSGSLQVRFSRSPFKADPMIKTLIEKEKAGKRLTIVTNDMDIVRFATANYAKTSSCEAFFEIVKKRTDVAEQNDKKYDRDLSEEELADWLRLFGESDS